MFGIIAVGGCIVLIIWAIIDKQRKKNKAKE
ncbi:hypothetical protein FHX76_001517 [Lysinibacter cavernae]|uniref:Uncharacterized protein n=1 Tax=Lysinibacter cavernae TaxID=1640652 RepID=A0A7X5TTL6_9MICO|nr:hypothetical protein [Lysinibacter cavernae]